MNFAENVIYPLKKTITFPKFRIDLKITDFDMFSRSPPQAPIFVRSKLIKFLWITPSNEGKMGQGAARGISRVNGCDTVVSGLTADLKHNLDRRFCIQNV